MKLEGNISILISPDKTTIQIQDTGSRIQFIEITLTPEQLSAVLSRQAYVNCQLEVKGLEKVGTVQETMTFEFEMIETYDYKNRSTIAHNYCLAEMNAKGLLTEGWEADKSYSSQGSFFKKEDKQYARTTLRRWV